MEAFYRINSTYALMLDYQASELTVIRVRNVQAVHFGNVPYIYSVRVLGMSFTCAGVASQTWQTAVKQD